jgi:hypothetical protein
MQLLRRKLNRDWMRVPLPIGQLRRKYFSFHLKYILNLIFRFYQVVQMKPCNAKRGDGVVCTGRPVMIRFNGVNPSFSMQ